MKFNLLCSTLLLSISLQAQAPFKYDSLYKRLYAKDLCAMMQKDKNVQLIDVRTPGEYNDTSKWASLNIGHLKGAVNITIDTLLKNIDLLKPYEGKTIVFYCSHSQRSRRASKFLHEKGWTNFYNLNGGMSVLNQMNVEDFPCKQEMLIHKTVYKNIDIKKAAKLMDSEKNLVIVDARTTSEFNSTDTLAENNIGHIKKAINIPYEKGKTDINSLEKYKNEPILIYASSNGNAAHLAKQLVEKGYSYVYHMLGGIHTFNSKTENRKYFDKPTPYLILDQYESLKLLKEKKDLVIFDTRSEKDFNNKNSSDRSWNNLGHIKNAVNVLDPGTVDLPKDQKTPILIYGGNDSRKLANTLSTKGYKNVYVLESYWDFVWSAFNIEACKENKNYLVDHAGLY